jgi:hypothetical protein
MKPVSPVFPSNPQREIEVAKNQPEYNVLPSVLCFKATPVTSLENIAKQVASLPIYATRWEAEDGDMNGICEGGKLYLHVLYFGQAQQEWTILFKEPDTSIGVIPPDFEQKYVAMGTADDDATILQWELSEEEVVDFHKYRSVWLFIDTFGSKILPLKMFTSVEKEIELDEILNVQ